MQKINIFLVGKQKEEYFNKASEEYEKRLKKFCSLKITEIPAENLLNESPALVEKALLKEAEKIKKALNLNPGFTVALCIEGKELKSEDFGELILNSAQKSSTVNFIIGSSYGIHPSVKNSADAKISFSKMTFPHRLFKIMLLEQIYRGYKIAEGSKYHK